MRSGGGTARTASRAAGGSGRPAGAPSDRRSTSRACPCRRLSSGTTRRPRRDAGPRDETSSCRETAGSAVSNCAAAGDATSSAAPDRQQKDAKHAAHGVLARVCDSSRKRIRAHRGAHRCDSAVQRGRHFVGGHRLRPGRRAGQRLVTRRTRGRHMAPGEERPQRARVLVRVARQRERIGGVARFTGADRAARDAGLRGRTHTRCRRPQAGVPFRVPRERRPFPPCDRPRT